MGFRAAMATISRDWNYESARFLDRYFHISLARLQALPGVPPEALKLAEPSGDRIEWADLFTVEQLLITYLPDEALPLVKAQILRRLEWLETSTVARTVDLWAIMEGTATVKPGPPIVRQDLISMLSQYYQGYISILDKEQRRNAMIYYLSFVTIGIFVIGLVAILVNTTGMVQKPLPYFQTLSLVIWSGLLGGSISVLLRLGSTETRDQGSTLIAEFDKAIKTSFLAPVTGSVFAVVLYVIFCAHLVDGTIFPTMQTAMTTEEAAAEASLLSSSVSNNVVSDHATNQQSKLGLQITYMHPKSSRDLSLVLVWCFIAGFFERFVPDLLSSIAKRNKSGDTKAK